MIKFKDEPIIIIGDINTEMSTNSAKSTIWRELLEEHEYYEYPSTKPSYVRTSNNSTTQSRLDHMFVNSRITIHGETELPNITKNDHIPFMFQIEIKDAVESWKKQYKPESPTEALDTIINSLSPSQDLRGTLESIKQVAQKPYIKTTLNTHPLKELLKEVNESTKEYYSDQTDEKLEELNRKKERLKQAQKNYYMKERTKWLERINNRDIGFLYKFDAFINTKSINWQNIPTTINESTTLDFFKKKFTMEHNNINITLPTSTILTGPSEITISAQDVKEALTRLKSHSTGIDFIPNKLLKEMNDQQIGVIALKFDAMINQTKDIPEAMKEGWIKLIPKKDSLETHKDLRPITIMSTLYRLLFNIISHKIGKWAKYNINCRQQAFTSQREVNNHILVLQALRMKYKKGITVTNLDIENAYDGVEHKVLQLAMQHCKFPPILSEFIKNAYSNHTTQIEWNNKLTEPFIKTRGVPQGCPLAPLMYNLITQIIIDFEIEKWKIPVAPTTLQIENIGTFNFADDCSLISEPNDSHNTRLKDLYEWIDTLKMKINAAKSTTTTLPKLKKHTDFKVTINNTEVPRTDNQRMLGNYLIEDCLLTKELEKRKSKIEQILHIIPTNQIEPKNLKRILMGKTISSFIHLARGNGLPESIIDKIDSSIRGKMKRALKIDAKVKPAYMYAPFIQCGLDLPNLKHLTNSITVNNILQKFHSSNKLVRNAVRYGIYNTNTTKVKKLNLFEKFNNIITNHKLKTHICNTSYTLKESKDQELYNNFNVWTDGSKIGNNVGYSVVIENENVTRNYKFKLHKQHTNNTAELLAIATTLHIIPPNSQCNIFTDSEIATKIISNDEYRGQFIQIREEICRTIEGKQLNVNVKWTKAHTGETNGNNYADKKAKNAAFFGDKISPQKLFTQNQLILTNLYNVWKPNPNAPLRQTLYQNFSLPPFHPTNFKFFKEQTTPTHKYSIWRNLIDAHLRSLTIKDPVCPHCDKNLTTEHLFIECSKMTTERTWMLDKIKEITKINAILTKEYSAPITNTSCYINIKGIMTTNLPENLQKQWPAIQGLLSLFGGKTQKQYNEILKIK